MQREWEAFGSAAGATFAPKSAHALATILDAAASARPRLAIDRVAFASFLGEKLIGASDPIGALGALHIDDLLVVFAAHTGVPGADAAFDAVLRPVAARVHGAIATGRSFDELLQELRVHFLIDRPGGPGEGDDRRARIRDFRGLSSLHRWIHVAATRFALNLVRHRPRELAFEDAFFLAQPDLQTPEAQLLDATYGGPLRSAVGRALSRLSERDQALLWLSLVDGRPDEHVAKIYGVHRTTASRWVQRAISELRTALESDLASSADLRASQLSSIVRTILAT